MAGIMVISPIMYLYRRRRIAFTKRAVSNQSSKIGLYQWPLPLPVTITSLYPGLHVIPSPWVWTWPSNSLLMNHIKQKGDPFWHYFTKICDLPSPLFTLMKPAPYCELPCWMVHVAGSWELSLAKSQQGTETLNPIAHKELSPANDHWMNLKVDVSLSMPSLSEGSPGQTLDCSLVRDSSWMIQLSHTHVPDP